jgi:NAD(P)-dependent dehydrogenase (short-subunit alcohol dehydrogenase family)
VVSSESALLRQDLLAGVSMLLAGPECGVRDPAGCAGRVGQRVVETCAALDAAVARVAADLEEQELDDAVAAATGDAGRLDLLVVDGAGLFAHGLSAAGGGQGATAGGQGVAGGGQEATAGGHGALRACLDGAWNATRAAVNRAFLAAQVPQGRIVYLAPAPDAGEHADAARAGLENLARTLSIEWARHGITLVTIAPGARTPADELATLVAYLASPAGAYFSGCLLDLRGVPAA